MKHAVLVVEDDNDVRETMADALADAGYEVRVAANGKEALEELATFRPCMVVLDLMMPVLDGWQVATAMHDDPRLTTIPVCIVSAVSDQAPPQSACVLQKPFTLRALLATVDKWCAPTPPREPD